LDAQPSSNVVLSVTSSDTGEATVSPSTLTFTSANWNTTQTVTVPAPLLLSLERLSWLNLVLVDDYYLPSPLIQPWQEGSHGS